jgi:RNA polymerase sigma-70 factor (ECF subfamily)
VTRMDSPPRIPPADADTGDDWLQAFHAGGRPCMDRCYREQFETVDRAVRGILAGADRETVVHEVFLRLLADAALRSSFHGGAFAAWLGTVARNQAIDYARRRRRELELRDQADRVEPAVEQGLEQQTDLRRAVERFRSEVLPAKWQAAFVARFLEGQDQVAAARCLGIPRTTLAYQEFRIRTLLRRFMLRGERP